MIGGFADGMKNVEEYEQVYKKYVNDVYRLALYLTRDEEEAKEITQQAFANVYKKTFKIDERSIYKELLITTKVLAKKQDTKEG